MSDYNDLVEALRYLVFERLQKKGQFVHGLLGDGKGRVSVPGRPDFSYARPGRQTSAVFEVFNKEVAGPDGWPVLIGELPWQPGLTQVVGTDWEAYTDAGWAMNSSLVGPHARQHEQRDGAPGTDPVNVYRRALVEMKTVAVGSGSFGVNVLPYDYDYGVPRSWGGTPTLDLAAAVPATGTARLMLTYLDPVSNSIGLVTGTVGVHSDAVELPRPALPTGTWFPSAYVRLYGGQSSILERDIRDARRLFAGGIATGTAGSGAPTGPAGGDLTGTYPDPTVRALLARPLSLAAPNENDVLTWTGSAWRPAPPPAGVGSSPTGPAGGDLTGTYPNPTVAGLYGRSLLGTAPATGDVLMWTGSAWRPAASAGLGWKLGSALRVVGPAGNYATVAQAVAASSPGDTILVDLGNYAIENVTIPDGVNLIGADRDGTILSSTTATVALALSDGCYAANFTLSVVGSHVNSIAMNIDAGNIAWVENVTIAQSGGGTGQGITCYSASKFVNCYVTAQNYALSVSTASAEVYGGYYSAGTYDIYSATTPRLMGPATGHGTVSSTVTGWYLKSTTSDWYAGTTWGLEVGERAAAPATPAATRWALYFKGGAAPGPYYIGNAGVERGPLMAAGDPAGGDLTGTYPDPTVRALLGRPLSNTAPAAGSVLLYTGSAWTPEVLGSLPPSGPAGGDLTGTYPNPQVVGLYGYPLLSTAPATGDVLMWTGSAWRPAASAATARLNYLFGTNLPTTTDRMANSNPFLLDGTNRLGFTVDTAAGDTYTPTGVWSKTNTGAVSFYVSQHCLIVDSQGGTSILKWTDSTAVNFLDLVGQPMIARTGVPYGGEFRFWSVQAPGAADNYWAVRFLLDAATYPDHPSRIQLWTGAGVTFAIGDGTMRSDAPWDQARAIYMVAHAFAGPRCNVTVKSMQASAAVNILDATIALMPTNFKTMWAYVAGTYQQMALDHIQVY